MNTLKDALRAVEEYIRRLREIGEPGRDEPIQPEPMTREEAFEIWKKHFDTPEANPLIYKKGMDAILEAANGTEAMPASKLQEMEQKWNK